MPYQEMKISLQKEVPPAGDLEARLVQLEGGLAANTAMTKEVIDGHDAIRAVLAKIDVEKLGALIGAVDSMRGGIRVLGWLERPAKWVAAVGAAGAVLYSIWSGK